MAEKENIVYNVEAFVMMGDECLYILFARTTRQSLSRHETDLGDCYDNLIGDMFAERDMSEYFVLDDIL